ncbi:hypothetical protein IEN85_23280 [Pelagicoccus sp. NFK12]|uniref:Uncharacterized protein n=1 Tax=Pelagicoccus enzymogenes TaxID=2773457 RepID=A0A927IHM4_9BACT|nr:hypothetical protein [Pelagicoccus enzymogenes]MBD5782442.1 hypothetical protein [Pelagicoccus enzymogenes]
MFLRCPITTLFIFALAISHTLVPIAVGQDNGQDIHFSVGSPQPNANLPASVPAPHGRLTLYADFPAANSGTVPLYLVNRTSERQRFESQDGDIYLKLEFQDDSGEWVRAQTHRFSFCGNSYLAVELPPGSHFAFHGYLPSQGVKANVRYKAYSDSPFASNIGIAHYREEDRKAAALDKLARRKLPPSLVRCFDFDKEHYDPDREQSFYNPGPDEILSALRLVSSYQESEYVRANVREYLNTVKKHEKAVRKQIAAFERILKAKWPEKPKLDALVSAAIEETDRSPTTAWPVLNDLLSGKIDPSISRIQKFEQAIAQKLESALIAAAPIQTEQASKLLLNHRFANENFEDSFFQKWIRSENDSLTQACANALSHRNKHQGLAAIGFELSPSQQLLVLCALASQGDPDTKNRRNPGSREERRFWQKCATEQPTQTVATLYNLGMYGDRNLFNLAIHDELREYLQQETLNPSAEVDGWEIGRVVSFVGAWKRREDVPLFQSLLDHPAAQKQLIYYPDSETPRFEQRRYRVREEASRILRNMGVSVPHNLVLNERVEIEPPVR